MRLKIYLKEALSLSQIKPFKDSILSKKYKTYLDHVFKGKDRIYLPFDKTSKLIKVPAKITKFIKSKNLEMVDYKKGIVKQEKGKNLLKLGKVLSKNKEHDLLKLFTNDKSRQAGKQDNLIIVISRHPYDIAGMSTGRGWTSCMNLETGEYKHYVNKDIKHGTIIAYIINSNDKNINKPLGRLLIKQFINVNKPSDIILYPEKTVYGTNVTGFRDIIIKWLETFQKFKGTYKIDPELYDDKSDAIGIGNKYNKDWEVRKLYYEKHPQDKDAKKENYYVRLLYYKNNPQDKDAKTDKDADIRKVYYKNNPQDKDAKTDENYIIKKSYFKNNPNDEDAKKENNYIRQLYYKNNPQDKDAKKENYEIRKLYYKNNPQDKDAKFDKNSYVREIYFKNNPQDKEK